MTSKPRALAVVAGPQEEGMATVATVDLADAPISMAEGIDPPFRRAEVMRVVVVLPE